MWRPPPPTPAGWSSRTPLSCSGPQGRYAAARAGPARWRTPGTPGPGGAIRPGHGIEQLELAGALTPTAASVQLEPGAKVPAPLEERLTDPEGTSGLADWSVTDVTVHVVAALAATGLGVHATAVAVGRSAAWITTAPLLVLYDELPV